MPIINIKKYINNEYFIKVHFLIAGYIETFNLNNLKKTLKISILLKDISTSKKNVLRGIHGNFNMEASLMSLREI